MIDFSGEPYFDDFSPNKHFHRILFKPGRAVQARELTQLQTILQSQISNFANHFFAQNTPVSGGNVTVDVNRNYIKLQLKYNDVDTDVNDFLNRTIININGTIQAKVIAVADAVYEGSILKEHPILILSYVSGMHFRAGNVIYTADDSNFTAKIIAGTSDNPATGKSSTAHISDGIFYVINGYSFDSVQNPDGTYTKYSMGNFVSVQPQSIIISKYNSIPSCRIGLNITETIHDYIDDVSLLDPALGSSNFQAPGADRYVIELTLEIRDIELGNDDAFIELVRIENGIIKKHVDGTVYSVIDDYFAKRTSETNGDYVVNNFDLTPKLATDVNNYTISIGPGIAYLRGYRTENQSTLEITAPRAREYKTSENENLTINYGGYFLTSNVKGTFDSTNFVNVDLHCVKKSSIATDTLQNYNSTLIGSGRLFQLDPYETSSSDSANYVYKFYVCDIETKTLSATELTYNLSESEISTITLTNAAKFSSVNDAYVGCTIILSTGESFSITAYNGSTKTITLDKKPVIIPTSTTTATLYFNVKDVEGITTSSSITAPYNTITAWCEIPLIGKDPNVVAGYTKYNDPNFSELLERIAGGTRVVKSVTSKSYASNIIFKNKAPATSGSDSILTIDLDSSYDNIVTFYGELDQYLSSSFINENYVLITKTSPETGNYPKVNEIIAFTSSNGRKMQITNEGKRLSITLPGIVPSNLTFDLQAKVNIKNAGSTSKILKTKTLKLATTDDVTGISASTAINSNVKLNLEKGQILIKNADEQENDILSLFVSDVKRIKKIVHGLSTITTDAGWADIINDSSYDITSYYDFNNGQKDNYYDHSYIKLKPNAPHPKGDIIVFFDYYEHGGGDGYFSVESYDSSEYKELDTFIAKTGTIYNLRDSIDYRPARKNGTANFELNIKGNYGCLVPDDEGVFTCDYSYYLGRKDLLVLKQDHTFDIILGKASENSVFPKQPDASLLLAKITLDPYTSYVQGEVPIGKLPNLSLDPIYHKRWTMEDISELQTRVNNLEYYNSLTLLEQSAQSLQITDANGLNRYKNGIFADDFTSFLAADTEHNDYNCSLDTISGEMSAAHNVARFILKDPNAILFKDDYEVPGGYRINHKGTTIAFSLPYVEEECFSQQLASDVVNVNPFSVKAAQGLVDLFGMDPHPDDDYPITPTTTDSKAASMNPGKDNNWKTIIGTDKVKTTKVKK